jgi:hypothetical protein
MANSGLRIDLSAEPFDPKDESARMDFLLYARVFLSSADAIVRMYGRGGVLGHHHRVVLFNIGAIHRTGSEGVRAEEAFPV